MECVGAIISQMRRRAAYGGAPVSPVKECRTAAGSIPEDALRGSARLMPPLGRSALRDIYSTYGGKQP